MQAVYGFELDAVQRYEETNLTQELGSVLCPAGRLLTFPNTMQHRVAPFALADRSRRGHRKILALFLVDPLRRVISTANVPPQQVAWARERMSSMRGALPRLPAELQAMVMGGLVDEGGCMSEEQARGYRLELMEERGARGEVQNREYERGEFSLCEH